MQTVASYNKAFEEAKAKLVRSARNLTKDEKMRVGANTNNTYMTINNYCNGKGTRLKTYLEIYEAINKL